MLGAGFTLCLCLVRGLLSACAWLVQGSLSTCVWCGVHSLPVFGWCGVHSLPVLGWCRVHSLPVLGAGFTLCLCLVGAGFTLLNVSAFSSRFRVRAAGPGTVSVHQVGDHLRETRQDPAQAAHRYAATRKPRKNAQNVQTHETRTRRNLDPQSGGFLLGARRENNKPNPGCPDSNILHFCERLSESSCG